MHVLYCTVLKQNPNRLISDNHVMYPRRQARTWCVLQTAETKMFLQKKKPLTGEKFWPYDIYLEIDAAPTSSVSQGKVHNFGEIFMNFGWFGGWKMQFRLKNSDKTDELMYPYITLISINKTTWETSTQSAASSIFWSSRLGFDPSWYPFCIFRLFFFSWWHVGPPSSWKGARTCSRKWKQNHAAAMDVNICPIPISITFLWI